MGTRVSGEKKPMPVPVCPLQFPYELAGHPLRKTGATAWPIMDFITSGIPGDDSPM
jgi:hypothetical protein